MDDLYISAVWNARQESIEQCAARLHPFMAELAECDPVFAQWYEPQRSRRSGKRIADFSSREYILAALDRGRNRTDWGKVPIEELGFQIYVWNDGRGERRRIALHILCGSYSREVRTPNSVNLGFPADLGALRDPENAARVLALVIRRWEPEHAELMSGDRFVKNTPPFDTPFVDWMLYLSAAKYHEPVVAAPATVQPVDSLGWLVVVQPDPIDPNNPDHLAHVKAVEAAIRLREQPGT